MKWMDWLGEFGKELRIHTKDIKKQRKWIEGLVSKIIVRSVWDKDRNNKDVQIGHFFDVHFKMKIVNDELSYKSYKKSSGYNVIEGDKILITNLVEGITSRQGKKLSKKKTERLLKTIEEQRVTVINNSVTVE